MSTINIHRGTFLEKEELVRMLTFLKENPSVEGILAASVSFGLVSPMAVAGNPFSMRVSTIPGAASLTGGYVIPSTMKSFKVDDNDNFPIPDDSVFYWVKVALETTHWEVGTVQVDANGNVSGTVHFNDVVRGQGSGVPSCIRFAKEDGTTPQNSGVYQVVDILNDTTLVLASGHNFVAESGLKVIVLGTIPMGQSFTSDQLQGLYTFDRCKISLVPTPADGTIPVKNSDEFYIARVQNNGGIITVLDERTEFWSLGFGSGHGNYKFTIRATPSNAKVIINGISTNTVEFSKSTNFIWSVSYPGYITKTGVITLDSSLDIDVSLEIDPNPQTYTISAQTSDGTTSEGAISVNNTAQIDKSSDSVSVLSGTTVQIAASPASGYSFSHWNKNGAYYNSVPIQEVPANGNDVYVAVFVQGEADAYWNFNVSVPGGGEELMTVPMSINSGEYEAMMVLING